MPMDAPLHRLDLNLLRVLVALDRARTVTGAGRLLALSQPATSNALARLRGFFNDALYTRGASGLVPTPLAARLAPAAAALLDSLAEAVALPRGFDATSSTRAWRLSLSDLGELVFLPAITEAVQREAPGTRLVNAAVPADEVAEALARRDIDLAIGILPARQRGLRSTLLFRESYVALGDARLPARLRTRAGLQQLGLVVASPTATFHGGIEAPLRRAGLAERIVVRTRHFAAMPDLVRQAPLAAIVPATWAAMVCRQAPLVSWSLGADLPLFDVRLLWHAGTEGDGAVDWLRSVVQRLFRQA